MNTPEANRADLNSLLTIAIQAALLAGAEILKIYESGFSVAYKKDKSPLTEADQNAHLCISSVLAPTGIPLLSEEGNPIPYKERKDLDRLWIVDPLDGTKEFIQKNGEFTVNIALIQNQKAVLGVIYQPTERLLYFASEKGAFKIENCPSSGSKADEWITHLNKAQKLPLRQTRKTLAVAVSRSHQGKETALFIETLQARQPGLVLVSAGSSLKFCLLAEGTADLYPRFGPTNEWDTAAGQAILEQAGGEVIDSKTEKPMLYNREVILNNSFLARAKLPVE
ncbi:MAG TPA: 3'(2'),5'-bisphosphate nucleotidase CysQ [Bacteroidia bacterium]|jgi:3'(2'), 5'-bisphosphate nucleotidase|nr:3'(2'),5'-bisphosphate nucleotidase CysQ [Bacteroidia bacterium]